MALGYLCDLIHALLLIMFLTYCYHNDLVGSFGFYGNYFSEVPGSLSFLTLV